MQHMYAGTRSRIGRWAVSAAIVALMATSGCTSRHIDSGAPDYPAGSDPRTVPQTEAVLFWPTIIG